MVSGRKRKGFIDYECEPKRKVLTIPDQSLSLREIMQRYVRGVPVDVTQREGVWIDQEEYDFESLARGEFSEKMSIAEELRAKYDAQVKAVEEAREAKRKQDEKQALLAELKAQESEGQEPAPDEGADA